MKRLEVSTDVYVPPERVYEFLVDFPSYAQYSEYLTDVERRGDGSVGTVYAITAAWWRLSHTVRSEVTDLDPPNRIDWRLLGPLQAAGAWVIEPVPDGTSSLAAGATTDVDAATCVTLVISYDPDSASPGQFDLPRFLSIDALVDRLVPRLEREATRTVERIVADLEGEPRPVELRIDVDSAVEPPFAPNGDEETSDGNASE